MTLTTEQGATARPPGDVAERGGRVLAEVDTAVRGPAVLRCGAGTTRGHHADSTCGRAFDVRDRGFDRAAVGGRARETEDDRETGTLCNLPASSRQSVQCWGRRGRLTLICLNLKVRDTRPMRQSSVGPSEQS